MGSQFQFYDFVAYLIPGVLVLSLCQWCLRIFGDIQQCQIIQTQNLNTVLALLFYLAVGYAFGHLVQDFGSTLEKKWIRNSKIFKRKDYNRASSQLVDNDNPNICEIINQTFPKQLLEIKTIDLEKLDPKLKKNLRRLCHDFATQEGFSKRIDTLNGLYRFHRGLLVFVFLSGIANFLHFILQLTIVLPSLVILLPNFYTTEDVPELKIFSGLITSLTLIIPISLIFVFLGQRVNRFFSHFEKAVFREVQVWHARQNINSINNKNEVGSWPK